MRRLIQLLAFNRSTIAPLTVASFTAVLVSAALLTTTGLSHAGSLTLEAPDATPVTIHRDNYGVPHIIADTEIGVYYGQGFAVAQDRLYQMEINRRASNGTLAEMFGSGYISTDQSTRSQSYTESERQQQLDSMPVELQGMVESYVAGINAYLDSIAVNPQTYCPQEFAGITLDSWPATDIAAIIQYQMRRFGQFGGQELTRLSELNYYGQTWFDQNRPINDPTAPTTIPNGSKNAPTIAAKGTVNGATNGAAKGTANGTADGEANRSLRWSGITVRPEIIQEIEIRDAEHERLLQGLGLPPKFGSFAVQITTEKSATGNVMLLGCPQMGEPQANTANAINEVELTCPGLHTGGMTVPGIPGVIIGHNENMAWTLTSGISDNTDVYIETTEDETLTRYWHNGQWENFEAIADTVYDNTGTPYPFTIYRTIHGPVFGSDLSNNQAYTYKMTFWGIELDFAEAFYFIVKAESLAGFETAIELCPVSFNIFYAGNDQTIKYWHAGLYQDRTDGVDPRLPHNGDGTEEWGGLIPFNQLPVTADVAEGAIINWNNKPVSWWDNGDNVPWIGWHPVYFIFNYVNPITNFTFDDLKGTPQAINSHGTYQQAVEFSAEMIIDENIVPPGQSAFVDLEGVPSPHVDDQWPLHTAWEFKDMLFGFEPSDVVPVLPPWGAQPVLFQNRPNPFGSRNDSQAGSYAGSQTHITFSLPSSGAVTLVVYDPGGRRVKTLFDNAMDAGTRTISWDGLNDAGNRVPSGLYFYRLDTGLQVISKRMLLIH